MILTKIFYQTRICSSDSYLFFDFECRQENANHEPNLCVVHNEAGDEWVFRGDDTRNEFCEWLFRENSSCLVVAHNFQGYDGKCYKFRWFVRSLSNNFSLFKRYYDFTSLYPWCNKTTRAAVGHPQIITENFDDISTYFWPDQMHRASSSRSSSSHSSLSYAR